MSADLFGVVRSAAEEVQTAPSYFWDNRNRGADNRLVIQRTLDGCAFFHDKRGRRLVPAGHSMLFTQAEPTRYGYAEETEKPYRLRFLSLSPSPSLLPLFEQLRTDFDSVLPMPDDSESMALFREIFTRFKQRTFYDRFHQSELAYRLLIALYREQVHETRSSDPIEFGYHFLKSHFRSGVNLKCIAGKCGVSREHFIRQFGVRYGEPPGKMLRRLRLEHADAMLAATRLGVEAVALASGFASPNGFGRAYRLKFGRSPRAKH